MDYSKWIREFNSEMSGTVLFTGEEKLLIEDSIMLMKSEFVNSSTEDFNFTFLDGATADFVEIENAVETLPFMSRKKLIVLNDVGAYIDNKKPDEDFYDFLFNIPKFCVLALVEREVSVPKTGKLYKRVNKNAVAVDCNKLNSADINTKIGKWLYDANKRMDRTTLAYFINEIGYFNKNLRINLSDLKNELDKIISHSENEFITKDDIDDSLIKAIDANIFRFTDALLQSDTSNALKELDRLLSLGENEFKIMTMITRQQRLLMEIGLLRGRGYSDSNIRDKLSLKQFEFDKLRRSSYTKRRLKRNLMLINELDYKMKSTGIDYRIGLEALIIKMCR